MLAENENNLDYLRQEALQGYSTEVFRFAYRLPLAGAILELAPVANDDLFYKSQIAETIGVVTLSNFHGGVERAIASFEKQAMIRRIQEGEPGYDINLGVGTNTHNYVRTDSSRWDIFWIALLDARKELGI
jgi:hypothetical protein